MTKSIYMTNQDKDRSNHNNNISDSYNDSMLSSNDRRRVLTTMMNDNRGVGDYSGRDTLNSFLYDN